MDLLGGVGQVPLRQPDHLTEEQRQSLPAWLQDASDPKDQGRIVSGRFLDLEKRELERMKSALSYDGSSSSTGDPPKKYRVAGIEKGTKNRYHDIYPFDHSRVRLEGIPSGSCDYVNANHIKAEFSNRRYIATQAPVPDTFNVSASYRSLSHFLAAYIFPDRTFGVWCGNRMSDSLCLSQQKSSEGR
jgi:protein-tyrosine phosphatase